MKVKVQFTIDIDAEAWAQEYGIDPDDVPGDVQDNAWNMAHSHAQSLGLLAAERARSTA